MQFRTKQGLQTLRRAHSFLSGREFSTALGDLKPHVESLATLVEKLEQHATEQDNRDRSARASTDAKKALSNTLRQEYLRPIGQVARRLFANDATIRNAFKLPRNRDDEGLLQAANGIAERAAEYQARFVGAGLAPDFVERLRKATAALRDIIIGRGLELGRRSAASAGMLEELARGRDLVRLLDTMLAPRLAQQRDQLAEWRTITRFIRVRTTEEVPVTGGGSTGTGAIVAPSTPEVKAA
ncbi:MAG: hypothetical protein IPF87_14035 [Gemmatimonadetes bacterium]|nr:hypothetical protein [Gemmatimonadota bacterium]